MSKQKKKNVMTKFFLSLLRPTGQDGANCPTSPNSRAATEEVEPVPSRTKTSLFSNLGTESKDSSASNSPAKMRPRLVSETCTQAEVCPSQLTLARDPSIHNCIAAFPTLNQPVMDTTKICCCPSKTSSTLTSFLWFYGSPI